MKLETLKNNREFKNVYKRGKSTVTSFFVVYYLRNNKKKNRIGFTTSKKLGCAVIRNRIRRRVKELFYSYCLDTKYTYDIVIVCRKRAMYADFERMKKEMHNILRRLK